MFDPFEQVAKAKDAKRSHDVLQIKESLDVYYNDHNCYPLYIPFGQEWNEGQTLYMKKVPQDPDYPKQEYTYQVDPSEQSCPQWNVLYAKHNKQRGTKTLCPLTSLQNCTPTNYVNTYACSFSGSVNCPYIASNPIPQPPAPTSTPVPTLSPTPTPQTCQTYYACSGEPTRCNNLGNDENNLCAVHGGSYFCYCEQTCNLACPGG